MRRGGRYIDGGVRSFSNADYAKGCRKVLILSPVGFRENPLNGSLRQEVELLERGGSSTFVIAPDEAASAAMGPNPLDPAFRASAAQAGLEQGRRLAAQVLAFWRG